MMTPEQTSVVIDGHTYDLLPLDALESIAHGAELVVEYPPPGVSGWATTVLGSQQWAAWFGVDAA